MRWGAGVPTQTPPVGKASLCPPPTAQHPHHPMGTSRAFRKKVGWVHPPPCTVTCELPRVVCWWARRQHNRQHMQFTRRKEKLVKSRKAAPGAFRKKVCEMQCDGTFLRGNTIGVIHAIQGHGAEEQITNALTTTPPPRWLSF